MAIWVKDPTDIVWFQFDWSAFLGTGETIITYDVQVGEALNKEADSDSAQAVNFKVSGGTTGDSCLVVCTVNTSNDNTFKDEKTIYVVDRIGIP